MRLYTNTMLDWVYNPVISGWYTPAIIAASPLGVVYNPVISGWCIPGTGIQFPKALVVASHVTTSKQSIPASTTTMHLHRR